MSNIQATPTAFLTNLAKEPPEILAPGIKLCCCQQFINSLQYYKFLTEDVFSFLTNNLNHYQHASLEHNAQYIELELYNTDSAGNLSDSAAFKFKYNPLSSLQVCKMNDAGMIINLYYREKEYVVADPFDLT